MSDESIRMFSEEELIGFSSEQRQAILAFESELYSKGSAFMNTELVEADEEIPVSHVIISTAWLPTHVPVQEAMTARSLLDTLSKQHFGDEPFALQMKTGFNERGEFFFSSIVFTGKNIASLYKEELAEWAVAKKLEELTENLEL